MKPSFKIIVVFIVLLLTSRASIADVFTEPQSLQSPNVATLGTFREPEVALHTGTPSISIPIYEVGLQNYTLPIELQYNGKSIQVDQCPSWVGLGWNLSAGGVVTRRINDHPDDITYDALHFTADSYYDAGFYYRYMGLATDGWYNFFYDTSTALDISYTYYDTEPDEFFFSFPGYHGYFYINHQGMLEVQCARPVSVTLIDQMLEPPFPVIATGWSPMQRQPNSFGGFVITIEDGTQFIFGNDTSAIDYSAPFFDNQQTMVADAWHLTKIISSNKQEITFKYSRQKFTNQMYAASQMMHSYAWSDEGFFGISEGSSYASCDISGKLLSPVYLREINTPLLKITFEKSETADLQYTDDVYNRLNNVSTTWRSRMMPYLTDFTPVQSYSTYLAYIHSKLARYKLDRIKIESNQGNNIQTINLTYSQSSSTRLTLSSVRFQDNSRYQFNYNHVELLPAYLSYKTDHWGYYNATYSGGWTFANDNYYQYREPNSNSNFVEYGILTDIRYPTGAKTHLEYEPNDYRKQVDDIRWLPLRTYSTNVRGGGVRIKSISFYNHHDDPTPTSQREYFYKKGYISNRLSNESSGILGASFKYNYQQTFSGVYESGNIVSKNVQFFTVGNVLPYCGNDNSSVCYSEVTEKISSGGYKVYKYTNYSDYMDEAPINMREDADAMFVPCTSMRHMRGLLTSVEDYDVAGTLVHKIQYTYTPNKSEAEFVRSVYDVLLRVNDRADLYIGASYKYYTHTMVADTIRDYKVKGGTIYDDVITVNEYNLHTQTLDKTHTITNDAHHSVEYIYPYDIRGSYHRLLADTMYLAHVYLPWEIIKRKDGNVIEAQFFNYVKRSNATFLNDAIYSLNITEPLTHFSHVNFMKIRDSHYCANPDVTYVYDSQGFVSEATESGITTSYLWGYNHSYIIAKIVGGSLSALSEEEQMQFENYSTRFLTNAELTTLHNELTTAFPQAMISAYSYNPLWGMTREIQPNGQSQYYGYDNMGRLNEVYFIHNNTKSVLKKYYYHYHE